jgi:hypothetical protein
VAAAVVGGVGSVLGGGKFANGAITGAFGYLATSISQSNEPNGSNDTDSGETHETSQIQLAVDGDLLETIQRAYSDAVEIEGSVAKWSRIARARGGFGEREVRRFLEEEGVKVLGGQVYVRTSLGLRVTDYLVTGGRFGNRLVGVEVKVNSAERSTMQIRKDNLIASEGGTIASRTNQITQIYPYGTQMRYQTYVFQVLLFDGIP